MNLGEIKPHIDKRFIKDLTSISNVYGIDRWEQEIKIFEAFIQRKNLQMIKAGDLQKTRDEVIEYVICNIIFPQTNSTFYIGKKFTSGRSESEKRKRSTDDFKKNILPTLGRDEKKHFSKKYDKK